MTKTWELIVEIEKPIKVSELEVSINEGKNLGFPINRSYEVNLIDSYWNEFTKDMANRYEKDILDALSKGDKAKFSEIINQVTGISSMYRLNDAKIDGKKLEIDMGITNFKEYIGTTQRALIDPQCRERLVTAGLFDHNDQNHYFANPLATCANIVTVDGFIPIGTRSQKVAIYPGVPHIIGGYTKVNGDNKPNFTVQDVDLFSNMKKELKEEMDLSEKDIIKSDFLGIVRNKITRGPEAMYNVSLNITADELHDKWEKKSKDKFEHRNIEFYSRKDLSAFLKTNKGTMVPSGEATLTLFLQYYK